MAWQHVSNHVPSLQATALSVRGSTGRCDTTVSNWNFPETLLSHSTPFWFHQGSTLVPLQQEIPHAVNVSNHEGCGVSQATRGCTHWIGRHRLYPTEHHSCKPQVSKGFSCFISLGGAGARDTAHSCTETLFQREERDITLWGTSQLFEFRSAPLWNKFSEIVPKRLTLLRAVIFFSSNRTQIASCFF
jgi:hypothetical protein